MLLSVLVVVLGCSDALVSPLVSPVVRGRPFVALRAASPPSATAGRPIMGALFKAVGESTRFAVSGAVATTLVVRRDPETLSWVLGAILAAVCNKVLKRVIKQERPTEGDDGGMPSSHACSVCHLGVGAALRFPLTPLQLGILSVYGATSLAWRVTNRYHTAPQVLVGGAFGAATAVAFRGLSKRLEAEVLPARIPLAWILGIYGAGAVVVGSVERAKWLKRALKKKR